MFKKSGPGFWKFNFMLLVENEYIDGINALLSEANDIYSHIEDKGLKWDTIKCSIRTFTINYSKAKAIQTRDSEALLLKFFK